MRSIRHVIVLLLSAAAASNAASAQEARFDWVEYDNHAPTAAALSGKFTNPVLAGFYPDPSVVRVGADFYLVNSTFSWFPGIPVWKSGDLVHWKQIGNAIDRPGQLDFTGLAMSRGVFAPAISYDNGRFYIVNTCVGCGGNFVITATDPAGPWSDPIWLPYVDGIDPALFFDTDGTVWIAHNSDPVGKPRYEGHKVILLHQVDPVTFREIGKTRMLVDGGTTVTNRPFWVEGPHIYKKDGFYYLMAAEGGTQDQHSEVVFRSQKVDGPYEEAPPGINPILTQRDLDPGRAQPIGSSGHADLIELADHSWWAVFLATRPYQADFFNTGRETFLLPVTWANGWPTILPHGTPVPTTVDAPRLPADTAPPTTGSHMIRDDFDRPGLDPAWLMMRTPKTMPYRIERGQLALTVRDAGIGDGKQPSFVARRQQQADVDVTTQLRFVPGTGETAGLAAVQNDAYFLAIGVSQLDGRRVVRAIRRAGPSDPAKGVTLASAPVASAAPIQLRITARGARYTLSYATGNGAWKPLSANVDGTILSTQTAGGFVGTMIGPFAQRDAESAPGR